MRIHDPLFVFLFALMLVPGAVGQEYQVQLAPSSGGGVKSIVVGPDGKPIAFPGAPVPGGAVPSRPGRPMPAEKKEDDDNEKEKEAKDANKKEKQDDSKVLTRPDKPPMPANPDELNVAPNSKGLIAFNFRYQSWPDVLDWLAAVSKMSLDWQELPKDFLNLTTQRQYTVVETRDLINRHLLARGFTLLENGEVLSVVATAKLNPAMVPRIEAEDLDELAAAQPYKFIKVSFALDWLLADQAAKELEPMLSTNGKLVPLTSTNRLEAMDAAINLREINVLLRQEQSHQGESPLVKEFVLEFARAADVLSELETLLGLESKKASAGPMSANQMRALQQQQQQMAQQMAQQRGGPQPPPAAKKEAQVNLVVNKRKNSILAHAPPDKMAIIAQAIEALDVRPSRTDSLLARPNQMEIYRLHNVDPAALAKTLEDLGDLQPTTRLDVDEKNNALIVYGALIDQAMIRQLVQRLDGNSRHFEVVRLRRLAADYVAGTVEFMMGGEEQKEERPRYYDYFSSRYGSRSDKSNNGDTFRVDADVQNNMLLLWANEQEVEAVMQLLEKLGELPPKGGNPNKVRVLGSIAPEDAAEFLEKLRRAWPSLSPNELLLPKLNLPQEDEKAPSDPQHVPPAAARGEAKEARAEPESSGDRLFDVVLVAAPDDDDESPPAATRPAPGGSDPAVANPIPKTPTAGNPANDDPANDDPASDDPASDDPASDDPGDDGRPVDGSATQSPAVPTEPTDEELLKRFFSRQRDVQREGTVQGEADRAAPPITLSFAPDGSLVITSEDTDALDVLEELISQTAPPPPDYRIFKLKYADAYWVMDNIEAFFKEDEEEDKNSFGRIFYGFPQSQSEGESRSRLSQRRKLKFIYDLDTNSILVQGADARQLKTIEDLIEIYDQPEPTNSQSARVSTVFSIKYSRAAIVAEAIKDVYRDLLSFNDKALQTNNPETKNREARASTFIFGGGGEDEPERTQVKFKGKLSIGVDEVSNTLLVSAEGENLMQNVGEMIKSLDEAAKPLSSYSIIHLKGNTNAARVREVLSTLLTDGPSSPAPPAAPPQNAPNREGKSSPQANSPAPMSVAPF